MLKRLNKVLPELIAGIVGYGVIVELAGVWFASDKLRFTTGLMIGIVLACGMAIHMASVLLDAVETNGMAHGERRIIIKSVLRYLIIVIVFFVMMKWNLGNLISAFIGVLGLKVSAYLQPFTHKINLKLQGRGDESSDIEHNSLI